MRYPVIYYSFVVMVRSPDAHLNVNAHARVCQSVR